MAKGYGKGKGGSAPAAPVIRRGEASREESPLHQEKKHGGKARRAAARQAGRPGRGRGTRGGRGQGRGQGSTRPPAGGTGPIARTQPTQSGSVPNVGTRRGGGGGGQGGGSGGGGGGGGRGGQGGGGRQGGGGGSRQGGGGGGRVQAPGGGGGGGGAGRSTSAQMQPDVRTAIDRLGAMAPEGEYAQGLKDKLGGDVRDWMARSGRGAVAGQSGRGMFGTGAGAMERGAIAGQGNRMISEGLAGISQDVLGREESIARGMGALGGEGGRLQLGEKEHQRGLMSDQAQEFAQRQREAQNQRELDIRETMNAASQENAKWGRDMDMLNMMSNWMA